MLAAHAEVSLAANTPCQLHLCTELENSARKLSAHHNTMNCDNARFEVLIVVMMQTQGFWNVSTE